MSIILEAVENPFMPPSMFGEMLKYLPSNVPSEAFKKTAVHPTYPLELKRIPDLCPCFFLHTYFPIRQPEIINIHPVLVDFARILVISFAWCETKNATSQIVVNNLRVLRLNDDFI